MQAFASCEWYNLSVHMHTQMSVFLNAQHPKAADVFNLRTKNTLTVHAKRQHMYHLLTCQDTSIKQIVNCVLLCRHRDRQGREKPS